jgi:hypothetical protein
MARGVPIFASRHGGLLKRAGPEFSGYLAEPHERAAPAREIGWVFSRPQRHVRPARRAWRMIKAESGLELVLTCSRARRQVLLARKSQKFAGLQDKRTHESCRGKKEGGISGLQPELSAGRMTVRFGLLQAVTGDEERSLARFLKNILPHSDLQR